MTVDVSRANKLADLLPLAITTLTKWLTEATTGQIEQRQIIKVSFCSLEVGVAGTHSWLCLVFLVHLIIPGKNPTAGYLQWRQLLHSGSLTPVTGEVFLAMGKDPADNTDVRSVAEFLEKIGGNEKTPAYLDRLHTQTTF
jgi:hypothetical protein